MQKFPLSEIGQSQAQGTCNQHNTEGILYRERLREDFYRDWCEIDRKCILVNIKLFLKVTPLRRRDTSVTGLHPSKALFLLAVECINKPK